MTTRGVKRKIKSTSNLQKIFPLYGLHSCRGSVNEKWSRKREISVRFLPSFNLQQEHSTMNPASCYHRGSVREQQPSRCTLWFDSSEVTVLSPLRSFISRPLQLSAFTNSAAICCSTVSRKDLTPLLHASMNPLALGVGKPQPFCNISVRLRSSVL